MNRIKSVYRRIYHSPTAMTWSSHVARSGNLILILPLILAKLNTADVALWYFFSTILVLSNLADFGFRGTFIRLIAFAFGGAKKIKVFRFSSGKEGGEVNWDLIEQLVSIMKRIYIFLSVILFILLLTIGSFFLIKPVSYSIHPSESWAAWGILALAISASFFGKIYTNYLEGLFEISLVKRVETVAKLCSLLTSFLILAFYPSLFNLVLNQSVWLILNRLRDYILARRVQNGKLREFKVKPFDKQLFSEVWAPAWRSGVSGLMSNGLTNFTGILYAQIGNPSMVAAYMIALRIVSEIRNVSSAPFYSKIPLISKLRAESNYDKLIKVVKRGMFLSHITFVVGTILAGLFFDYFIGYFTNDIQFVETELWLLLCMAFYVHRYGAFHMQLYLTTNHVIAHIADFVAGILFILSTLVLIDRLQLYAVPIGMLIGYLGFYSWYAAYHSLKSIRMGFFRFEFKVSFVPFLIFVAYMLVKLGLLNNW